MILLNALFGAIVLYLSVVITYLMLLTIGAFAMRKKCVPDAPPLRIAVVMPAHNEKLQVGPCIRRVMDTGYPHDRFSIIVIADNCTDETADRARDAGAIVFERFDHTLRGKGQALDWLFRTQAELLSQYDAIAVVDADTEVHRDFLREASSSLAHPDVQVVQGYHGVSNPSANWRTALTSAGFTLVNGLRPAGRNHWGGSADLKGNGMAFRTGLLLKYGWPAHSIVEDLEFSLRLLLDGTIVHFNPDAVVISEMPTSQAQAEPQRRRWESGRLQMARSFVPRLLAAFVRNPRWRYLDAALELIISPLSAVVFLEGVALAIALLMMREWLPFCVGIIAATIVYVAAGLCRMHAPGTVWRGLLLTPLFLLWKIPFYARLAFSNKPTDWQRTQRKAEMTGSEDEEPPRVQS
ncbi:MAG: glycosyltransferase [Candidatus Hydrogenedentes bacterium]|nr:glycosyltransferase [Candidatus Hydrogenedentota bacterium]